jgi:acetyltransferase-like isoleucine patch superfamily enzyme
VSLGGRVRHYADEPAARAALRARLVRPYRVARFDNYGKGSMIHRPMWIYGAHHISVGDYVLIMPGVWLAAERASWGRPAPALTIGDGTAIRSNCVLSATESVTIEENVLIAGSCTIIDSDHTVGGGRNPLHNPTVSAPVRIGAGTWLGERVTVLRGSDIGRECIIGAHSVVRGTIPDHSIAVGAPARVVGSTRDDDGGYSPA